MAQNVDYTGNTLIVEDLKVGASSSSATTTSILDSAGKVTAGSITGGVQAVTAAGAVNLTTLITTVATSGAIALTLAAGTTGQVKIITMITDGGDATLTPTNFANGTTITFNDVNDTVMLVYAAAKWYIVSNSGATVA